MKAIHMQGVHQRTICKNIFIDDEYREIAIDGIREVDTQHISPQTLVYTGIVMYYPVFRRIYIAGNCFCCDSIIFITKGNSYI